MHVKNKSRHKHYSFLKTQTGVCQSEQVKTNKIKSFFSKIRPDIPPHWLVFHGDLSRSVASFSLLVVRTPDIPLSHSVPKHKNHYDYIEIHKLCLHSGTELYSFTY